jgi:exopolysaccharide biosynthesis polyprenyl glycosylphosphotransferase
MVKKEELYLSLATFLSDALAIIVGFILAYLLRFYSGLIPVTKGIPPLQLYFFGSLLVSLVWICLLAARGLYRPRRWLSLGGELGQAFRGAGIGTLVVLAFTFFYREPSYSRVVLVLACTFGFLVLASGRLFLYQIHLGLLARGIGTRRTAIVGSGEVAAAVAGKITSSPHLGYQPIGVVVEDVSSVVRVPGLRVLGTADEIMALIERETLETLILALPAEQHRRVLEAAWQVEGREVDLKFVPDLYELMTSKVGLTDLDGIPLIGLREFPLQGWNRVLKRSLDIAIALFGLLFLSPPFLIIAFLVKLTSRGHALYKQNRIGQDGKRFAIFKFRSMVENAEVETGPVWAEEGDPRQTRLGRLLRRFNLDELPQLWNVLKGDMSLVGPRPERSAFVEEFRGAIPRYFERHQVKSGITGWAQVNGLRGNTPIGERTRYDLYYVENWSLGFDLWILLLTLFEPILRNCRRKVTVES